MIKPFTPAHLSFIIKPSCTLQCNHQTPYALHHIVSHLKKKLLHSQKKKKKKVSTMMRTPTAILQESISCWKNSMVITYHTRQLTLVWQSRQTLVGSGTPGRSCVPHNANKYQPFKLKHAEADI